MFVSDQLMAYMIDKNTNKVSSVKERFSLYFLLSILQKRLKRVNW
jgi:hypothetical protein